MYSTVFYFLIMILTSSIALAENNESNIVKKTEASEILRQNEILEKVRMLKNDDIYFGNKESKVIVVEYFSPSCPQCSVFYRKVFTKLKEKYIDTNKILYIKREFVSNKQDWYATALMRCKNDNESYAKFLEIIMTNQDGWFMKKNFDEILTNIGILGGLTPQQYTKCIQDKDLLSIMKENSKDITRIPGVHGTPFFIIGTKNFFDGIRSFESFSKYIEEELKAQAE